MLFIWLDKYRDTGLLLLRIGFGLMFLYHGYPKITGGMAGWEKLGITGMQPLGITLYPVFWGLMSAITEFAGGILILLGLFFRPACMLLTINMLTAMNMKFTTGAGLTGAAPALEDGIVFASLIFIGPGLYSLDQLFCKKSAVRRIRY